MTVFRSYARYYDLLYRDKDYRVEADFVMNLIRKYAPSSRKILELGCGTGLHALLMAERGYSVHGVDISTDMLASAAQRKQESSIEVQRALHFSHGDVRSYRAGATFDTVISLFHVLSYQTTNDDLLATFHTAGEHLQTGGILICDFWYGPAVLSQKPETRIKRLGDADFEIIRIAEPVVHDKENIVDVNYEIRSVERSTLRSETVRELHRMRYLFLPELELFADRAGLTSVESLSWLTDRPASVDSWSVCAIFIKR